MEGVNPLLWLALAAIVIVVLLVWWMSARKRTAHLRDTFGDEYDRTVETVGSTGKAEAALAERERRVSALEIRPLTGTEKDGFTHEWNEAKTVFVDSPPEAVLRADRVLANIMKTKGYPMADFDRRHEDLTVDHRDVARHYLAGHEITERHSRGDASTEDLRQAMMHYEALFERLVADVAPTGDAMSTASIHTADAPIEERHGHPVSPALSRRVEEVR